MPTPRSLVLLSMGFGAACSVACGQTPSDLCVFPARPITTPPAGATFCPATETTQIVFAISSPTDFTVPNNNRGTFGSAALANDGSFPAFPPGSGINYPLSIDGFCHGWTAFGPAVPGSFDYQCTFYDNIDMTVRATPSPFYSTVIGTFRQNNITPTWNIAQWYQDPIALTDAEGRPVRFNFPHRVWGCEVKIFETGTSNLWNGASHGGNSLNSVSQIVPLVRGGAGAAPMVGNTSPSYFRNNPVASDATLGADSTVLNTSAFNTGSASSRRDIYMKLRANFGEPAMVVNDLVTGLPLSPPISPSVLDCQGQSFVERPFVVAPGESRFFAFRLAHDVSVEMNTFLDVTTSTDGPDMKMALYDSAGNLIVMNDDDGGMLNPQLTFGHGRRASLGGGIDCDGHDGDLGAGLYYIAIGGEGTVFGATSFNVNAGSSVEAGNCTIRLGHNTGSGAPCPLPDAVAPTSDDLGILPRGVTTSTTARLGEIGFGMLRWMRFETTDAIRPARPAHFLDVSADPPLGTPEVRMAIYDSSGNLLAQSENLGQPQLSFSTAGVKPPRGMFDGQSGNMLPAGEYYLAIALEPADFRDTGWQGRSASGAPVDIPISIFASAGCDTDFNADGDVDADDLNQFLLEFFSGPARAGFNDDGLVDPDDLGDFITMFFSSPCH